MIDSPRYTIGLVALGVVLIAGAFAFRQFVPEGSDMTVITEPVTQEFAVGDSPQIVIQTFNGDVTVTVGGPGVLKSTITRKGGGRNEEEAFNDLSHVEVRMVQDGNTIRVTARRADGAPSKTESGAKVEISAPPGATVDARSSNGDIGTEGITGETTARTSNGAIELDGASGRVTAANSNGHIRINPSGPVLASAESSNGAITFTGQLAPGESSFTTSNGSITLELPAATAFAIDATTSNGTISSDFPISGTSEKTRLAGETAANPVSSIRAKTSNGKITIRRQ